MVKDCAGKGDMKAAAIVLARVWPRRRGRPLELDLPSVETPDGLVRAHAALIAALSRGELTPEEAASVGSVLETQRRAIETLDHERRLVELEAARAGKGGPQLGPQLGPDPATGLWEQP